MRKKRKEELKFHSIEADPEKLSAGVWTENLSTSSDVTLTMFSVRSSMGIVYCAIRSDMSRRCCHCWVEITLFLLNFHLISGFLIVCSSNLISLPRLGNWWLCEWSHWHFVDGPLLKIRKHKTQQSHLQQLEGKVCQWSRWSVHSIQSHCWTDASVELVRLRSIFADRLWSASRLHYAIWDSSRLSFTFEKLIKFHRRKNHTKMLTSFSAII